MSLSLQSLKLKNFRNHQNLVLERLGRMVIIIGPNAAGKTNIIEALQLTSMLESFKSSNWNNLILTGESEGSAEVDFIQNERELNIKVTLNDNKRTYYLNNKSKRTSELHGLVPAVLFTPDDLSLVKDAPEARRRLVDGLGQQLSRTFQQIHKDYTKTVRQRNQILREQRETGRSSLIQESWDNTLISLGALLFTHRLRLFQRLTSEAAVQYQKLTQEELTSEYQAAFESKSLEQLLSMSKEDVELAYQEHLKRVKDEELLRGKTLIGPQRDEIIFKINNRNAREFGSQGQQRSITLALKLASLKLIEEMTGNEPLLLLDDVMSELDILRRQAFLTMIGTNVQVVITATDLQAFETDIIQKATIIQL